MLVFQRVIKVASIAEKIIGYEIIFPAMMAVFITL
jgi:hypothetical protein